MDKGEIYVLINDAKDLDEVELIQSADSSDASFIKVLKKG